MTRKLDKDSPLWQEYSDEFDRISSEHYKELDEFRKKHPPVKGQRDGPDGKLVKKYHQDIIALQEKYWGKREPRQDCQ